MKKNCTSYKVLNFGEIGQGVEVEQEHRKKQQWLMFEWKLKEMMKMVVKFVSCLPLFVVSLQEERRQRLPPPFSIQSIQFKHKSKHKDQAFLFLQKQQQLHIVRINFVLFRWPNKINSWSINRKKSEVCAVDNLVNFHTPDTRVHEHTDSYIHSTTCQYIEWVSKLEFCFGRESKTNTKNKNRNRNRKRRCIVPKTLHTVHNKMKEMLEPLLLL